MLVDWLGKPGINNIFISIFEVHERFHKVQQRNSLFFIFKHWTLPLHMTILLTLFRSESEMNV